MRSLCPATEKLMSGSVRLLVVLLHLSRDVGGKDGLQPLRRGGSVAPVIDRALRGPRPLHNLRCSPLQNKLGPAHGWTVKEKCGSRNFILDTVRIPHKDTCMSNTERSAKIIALFALHGVTISYATITADNRLGVRCESQQAELAAAALKGIGYSEIQTLKSFDEVTVVGSRA